MGWLAPLVLLAFGLAQGDYTDEETVSYFMKDGRLFRVVCYLNSFDNPQFNIRLTGKSSSGATLFLAIFQTVSGPTAYRMTLSAKDSAIVSMPHYEVLNDEGEPLIPLVMAYGQGILTCQTAGQGAVVNTTTQAADVETISVRATGSSIATCTCVQPGRE